MKLHLKLDHLVTYFILLVFGSFFFLRLIIVLSYNTDLAGIEQNVVYSIQMLMDKGRLYTSPAKIPFSITQYTPLYYYLCSVTTKIAGYSPDDIQKIYIIGRWWNLLFNVISAFTTYKIARSVFLLPKNTSYFLFLLTFSCTFFHNFAVRPDSLCDMFGLISLYYFFKYQSARHTGINNMTLLCAVLFTAMAFFSKQSGVQLLLIYGAFALFNADWKTLFRLIFFSFSIYGLLLLLFTYAYPSFLENIVGGVVNGINIQNFIKYIIAKNIFIITVWPLVIISVILIIKEKSLLKGSAVERLLATAVLGTLLFASITALKMGSTVQYYILFINLSLLLVLKVIPEHISVHQTFVGLKSYYKKIVLYGYLNLVILAFGVYNMQFVLSSNKKTVLNKQRNSAIETSRFIKHDMQKKRCTYIFAYLTTDTSIPSRQGINNFFYLNCIVPQMDILEYSNGPSKVIGYQNIDKILKDGEVGYIIASKPKSSFSIVPDLDYIISTKYRLIKTIDGYLIYKFLSK